jgi:hypothetical protein
MFWRKHLHLLCRRMKRGNSQRDWVCGACSTNGTELREVLSRVPLSVTNKNGSWIGWLYLWTPSFTISLNHNQWQQPTFNDCLRLAPFLNGLRVVLFLVFLLLWLTWFWFTNRHSFSFRCPLVNTPQLNTQLLSCLLNFLTIESRLTQSESEPDSYTCITTDGQSASVSWNKAPIWGLRSDFYYCQRVASLLM